MRANYRDIRERIAQEPLWYDDAGVPRYVEFAPDHCANIYAREVALMEIACQECTKRFRVAISWHSSETSSLAEDIQETLVHYGDPPNVECCLAGNTMNSVPIRIIAYWIRSRLDWRRDPSLEIDVFPEWARDGDKYLRSKPE